MIAHRTSPTNIGLALLANLAAYDFGYISADGLIDRTSRTLETMESLERFQGHLFNWYDTLTLRPLPPRYVSTVDSGNLAGHLLCLRAGLDELPDRPILLAASHRGAHDDPARFDRCRRKRRRRDAVAIVSRPRWARGSMGCGASSNLFPVGTRCIGCRRWRPLAAELAAGLGTSPDEDVAWWARALDRQCRDHLTTLNLLAPWLLLPPERCPRTARRSTERLGGARSRPCARWHVSSLALQPADFEAGRRRRAARNCRETIAGASARAAERITAIEKLSLRCGELADLNLQFLYDRSRHLLAIGYNVDDRRTRRELLRPAGVGSPPGQLRRDRAGPAAPGALVRPGAAADDHPGRAGADLVERLDVRVPDAAARDADLRGHAARPDVPGGRRTSDRVRRRSAACPGASRSRATTRPTST